MLREHVGLAMSIGIASYDERVNPDGGSSRSVNHVLCPSSVTTGLTDRSVSNNDNDSRHFQASPVLPAPSRYFLVRALFPQLEEPFVLAGALPGKLDDISMQVLEACDGGGLGGNDNRALDGIADGILNDPRRCSWDQVAASLTKCANPPVAGCFTTEEIDVLRLLHKRIPPGAEATPEPSPDNSSI